MLQEPKQRRPFGSSRSTADYDNDPVVRLLPRELNEIIPIAGQEHTSMIVCKLQDDIIWGIWSKNFAQKGHIVAELLQQIAEILGHIVIEQEVHSRTWAICRATSTSISPRWSS